MGAKREQVGLVIGVEKENKYSNSSAGVWSSTTEKPQGNPLHGCQLKRAHPK